MDEQTKKMMSEQMAILPEDVKNAILSVDYKVQLQEVTKRNHLLIDQAGALETETTLALLGLELLSDYVENISRELEIPREKAVIVAHDVDELIFKNIRTSLQEMNNESLAEEEEIETRSQENISNTELNRESVISGVENPKNIAEKSISISSLKSNSLNPEYPIETMTQGIEVRREISPELFEETNLPSKIDNILPTNKNNIPIHQNESPLKDIVTEKLNNSISIPIEKVVIEENSKIPQKSALHDPYRESII